VIQSNPAPGTTAHQVAIEGSETPLVIWIKELRPEKGARLQVGQVVSVMAQLGGPAGYEAKIAPYFRSGEKAVSGGRSACGNALKTGGLQESTDRCCWS
jgi:hypothetical protein